MSAKTKPSVVDISATVTPTDGPGERGKTEPRQDAQTKPAKPIKLDMVTIMGCLAVVVLAVTHMHVSKAAARRRLFP